jgi:hypothetical protein
MTAENSITAPKGPMRILMAVKVTGVCAKLVAPAGGALYPNQPSTCKARKIAIAPVSFRIKFFTP